MINFESTAIASIATSTVLPPPRSPIPTFVYVSNVLPTFNGVMQEPIKTLSSSQSTEKSLVKLSWCYP